MTDDLEGTSTTARLHQAVLQVMVFRNSEVEIVWIRVNFLVLIFRFCVVLGFLGLGLGL